MEQLSLVFPEHKTFKVALRIGEEKFTLDIESYDHKEARRSAAWFYPDARTVLVQIK